MRTASNNLIVLLNTSKQFYPAEIYTITLIDGTVLRYTTLDKDIVYSSNTYASKGLLIKRGKLSWSRGFQVDELELIVYPTAANIGNVAWIPACRNGALDGAIVRLQRLYYASWTANETGAITLFAGKISEIEPGRTSVSILVKSAVELLNVGWPINVYLPTCIWSLYDAGCGLNAANLTANKAVSGAGNTLAFNTTITAANNYYDQGVIVFTSGNSTGARRTVKSFANASGKVTVIVPLSYNAANGDAFSIYPGCDHLNATCNNKFTNANNFRGFPFIPQPEAGT